VDRQGLSLGPGLVARYRDQDVPLLGVAMKRFLQAKEGPEADLWTMMEREVHAPIGIHDAPSTGRWRTTAAPASR
jgi:hypothetical protein